MSALQSEQHDDHIWLTVLGQAWAIRAIRRSRYGQAGRQVIGDFFYLWRGYEPDLQYLTVEMINPDWDAYCAAAVAMLNDATEIPTD